MDKSGWIVFCWLVWMMIIIQSPLAEAQPLRFQALGEIACPAAEAQQCLRLRLPAELPSGSMAVVVRRVQRLLTLPALTAEDIVRVNPGRVRFVCDATPLASRVDFRRLEERERRCPQGPTHLGLVPGTVILVPYRHQATQVERLTDRLAEVNDQLAASQAASQRLINQNATDWSVERLGLVRTQERRFAALRVRKDGEIRRQRTFAQIMNAVLAIGLVFAAGRARRQTKRLKRLTHELGRLLPEGAMPKPRRPNGLYLLPLVFIKRPDPFKLVAGLSARLAELGTGIAGLSASNEMLKKRVSTRPPPPPVTARSIADRIRLQRLEALDSYAGRYWQNAPELTVDALGQIIAKAQEPKFVKMTDAEERAKLKDDLAKARQTIDELEADNKRLTHNWLEDAREHLETMGKLTAAEAVVADFKQAAELLDRLNGSWSDILRGLEQAARNAFDHSYSQQLHALVAKASGLWEPAMVLTLPHVDRQSTDNEASSDAAVDYTDTTVRRGALSFPPIRDTLVGTAFVPERPQAVSGVRNMPAESGLASIRPGEDSWGSAGGRHDTAQVTRQELAAGMTDPSPPSASGRMHPPGTVSSRPPPPAASSPSAPAPVDSAVADPGAIAKP